MKTNHMTTYKIHLLAAASELNKVLGLEPEIDLSDTNVSVERLEAQLREAITLLMPDDKFTELTTNVLKQLGAEGLGLH